MSKDHVECVSAMEVAQIACRMWLGLLTLEEAQHQMRSLPTGAMPKGPVTRVYTWRDCIPDVSVPGVREAWDERHAAIERKALADYEAMEYDGLVEHSLNRRN